MFNFFNSILDFLQAIGHLIVRFFQSTIDLLLSIPRMVMFLFSTFAYLPSFVAPYAFIIISLAIIYLIIGRKGDS